MFNIVEEWVISDYAFLLTIFYSVVLLILSNDLIYNGLAEAHVISSLKTDRLIKQVESSVLLVVCSGPLQLSLDTLGVLNWHISHI